MSFYCNKCYYDFVNRMLLRLLAKSRLIVWHTVRYTPSSELCMYTRLLGQRSSFVGEPDCEKQRRHQRHFSSPDFRSSNSNTVEWWVCGADGSWNQATLLVFTISWDVISHHVCFGLMLSWSNHPIKPDEFIRFLRAFKSVVDCLWVAISAVSIH